MLLLMKRKSSILIKSAGNYIEISTSKADFTN